MREGRLRLAASAGGAESQAGPLAVARSGAGGQTCPATVRARPPRSRCRAAFRSERRRAAAATSKPSDQIAPRWALPPPVATSMRRSMSRPIRPICSRSRSGDFSTAAARAMSAKPSCKRPGGTPQPGQIQIVMGPVTAAVHERRLRRQLCFLDEGRNGRESTSHAVTNRPRRSSGTTSTEARAYRGVDS